MADLHEVCMVDVDKAVQPAANGAGASGNGNGAAAAVKLMSDAELAALGYVKASSQPQQASAPMEFSGGLLPASAQADTYEDKTKARA
jgi:hypothetical protein